MRNHAWETQNFVVHASGYQDEKFTQANLDPADRLRSKVLVDAAGHYGRPDAVSVVIHDPSPALVARES
jgi:hypothetical protein